MPETQESPAYLLPHHRQLLIDSGIDPDGPIAKAREYRSIESAEELVFSKFTKAQRRVPGLLHKIRGVHGEGGECTHQYRPDTPRLDRTGKEVKYETPKDGLIMLDVPKFAYPYLRTDIPLVITEGARKADAACEREIPCISLMSGVWSFKGKDDRGVKLFLSDWDQIQLYGERDGKRDIYLAFDNDAMQKVGVYLALKQMKNLLEKRGAKVWIVYLPDVYEDGRKTGLDDYLVAGHGFEDLRAWAKEDLEPLEASKPILLEKSLGELNPTTLPLESPYGYRVTADGVEVFRASKNIEEWVSIAIRPLFITGVAAGPTGMKYQLTWRHDNRWKSSDIDKEKAVNGAGLIKLAGLGAPVTTNNLKVMADYLELFELQNEEILPQCRVSPRMGWIDDSFVVGRQTIDKDGIVNVDDVKPEDRTKRHVVWSGYDNAPIQGFRSKGSLEGWLQAIAPIEAFPKVLTTFYASFASSLLEVLDVPNFIVDLCAPTSVGKSTSLKIAASAWGGCSDGSEDSIIFSWNATATAMERLAQSFSGIPFILDDTKLTFNTRLIGTTLYMVAYGQGRARGRIEGMQDTSRFRTVLLTSGECPITEFTKDGGARMRTLTVDGLPFGSQSTDLYNITTEIRYGIQENHGHAGPLFVHWLLKNKDRWGEFRDRFRAILDRRAQGLDGTAARQLEKVAVIETAAELLHQAIALPWSLDPAVLFDGVAKDAKETADDAVGAKEAMDVVLSWASSNSAFFEGCNGFQDNTRALGRWHSGEELKIFAREINGVLDQSGFNARAVRGEWMRMGWLKSPDGSGTMATRIRNKVSRVVCIHKDAWVELGLGEDKVPHEEPKQIQPEA